MQPQWIKDYKNGKTAGKPVAEQVTVLRRTPPAAHNPNIRPMVSGSAPAQPMAIPQPMSRLTGAGVDGQLQPQKMTGQVHEGEGVINANAMQNLTPDEFNAFSQALESGQLDKNVFRRAIGLQPVSGYVLGGIVSPNNNGGFRLPPDPINRKLATQINDSRTTTTETPKTVTATPTQRVEPIQNVEPKTISTESIGLQPPPKAAPQTVTATPIQRVEPIQQPETKTISTESIGLQPPKPVTEVKTVDPNPKTPSEQVTTLPTPQPYSFVNAPAPTDRQTYYNDLFTSATGKDYRGTAAMAQENYDNSLMQRSGAADAAKEAAVAQELNQAGVSASGKATQLAELNRTQSESEDELRNKLANTFTGNLSNFSNIDIAQRNQALNEKQKALDNYRYDTEAATAKETTDYNRKWNEDERAYQRAKDAEEGKTESRAKMEERFGLLFNGGTTLTDAYNDVALQNMVKDYLGPNATPEAIQKEIALMFNSATENNRDTFVADSEKYIGKAIDDKRSIDEILNDQNIRRKVAGYLGPNATADDINKEISTVYKELNKPAVDRIFETFSENWVPENIKQVAGWDTDLKECVSDMFLKGFIDKDGNVKEGAVIEWPWEDPDTMFKYQDWNGKKVVAGTYDQAQTINIDGNGTKYVNASGGAVTMADANSKWNSILSSDRSAFMKNGEIDTATFLAKYFPTTKDSNGNTVALTTRDAFTQKVLDDPKYLDTVEKVLAEFQSGGEYPGERGKDYKAGEPIESGQFIYYDENGDVKISGKNEKNKLAYIYQQICDKFNGGDPLSSGQFSEYWRDGEGWRVADDGTIKNIDTRGKAVDNSNLSGIQNLSTWQKTSTDTFDKTTISALSKLSAEDRAKDSNFVDTPEGWGEFFLDTQNTPMFTGNKKKGWTGEGQKWVFRNIGKLYRSSDGKIYQVIGTNNDNGEAHVLFRDMSNNDVVKHNLKTNDNYNKVGSVTSGTYGNYMSEMEKTLKTLEDPEVYDSIQNPPEWRDPIGKSAETSPFQTTPTTTK